MKKAQAAMEFLMTYGWAILVLIIAISALAYFGVLNPSRFLPEHCIFPSGFSCSDFKVGTTKVDLVLYNGLGKTLKDVSVDLTDFSCGASTKTTWKSEEKLFVTLSCSDIPESSSKFKSDISITYISEDGAEHIKKGSLRARVE